VTAKRSWMALGAVLGAVLFLAGCELPMDPDVIDVWSQSFGSPADAGIIDAQRGVKFEFTSNIAGAGQTWWGRFQVPVTGVYNIAHSGQPVFEMYIRRNSQFSSLVASPANGETVTATFDAGINYYVEGYQPGPAMMGGTFIWVWAD
jgi:hypothetical protein